MAKSSKRKTNSDKKLNRFSTIITIITNLRELASWILSVGSAYILHSQQIPVSVPGTNFKLDAGFQFALIISGSLAYGHFLQGFWKRNKEKLGLSGDFSYFVFWDLPTGKSLLSLIPIILIITLAIQIGLQSTPILIMVILILVVLVFFVIFAFSYRLSPNRDLEKSMGEWENDDELKKRWMQRIHRKFLEVYKNGLHQKYPYANDVSRQNLFYVETRDFFDMGLVDNRMNRLQITWALHYYFLLHENDQTLSLESEVGGWKLTFNCFEIDEIQHLMN